MSRGKELKNTSYSISDQYPAEIMGRRRLLYPVMAAARKENKNARLFMDKLYIDGNLYRNSNITFWLSGGDENIFPDAQEQLPGSREQHASSPAEVNTGTG